jgi:hypothetical protein
MNPTPTQPLDAPLLEQCADDREVLLSFSSEERVPRGRCYEILSHNPDAIDLTTLRGGAPLLLDHEESCKVGIVLDAWLQNRYGVARVHINQDPVGEMVFQGVKKGIFRDVSVGYRVSLRDTMVEEVDGALVFRAAKWTPFEISLSSGKLSPRDCTVGVGRIPCVDHARGPTKKESAMGVQGKTYRVRPVSDFELIERSRTPTPLSEGEFDLLANLKLHDIKAFRVVYEIIRCEKSMKAAGFKELTPEEFNQLAEEIKRKIWR